MTQIFRAVLSKGQTPEDSTSPDVPTQLHRHGVSSKVSTPLALDVGQHEQ
jgi:hypothetical protein